MATTPDYPILGPPRISAAGFAAVLRAAGSPAAPDAAACYQAFVAAGVDPAVGLAVFRKESTYGRFGRANRNRSWGNTRGPAAGYPLDSGRFRIYPTWVAGARDCAQLLSVYGRNKIRDGVITSTVQTMPFVWAPSSDGNAPDRYGDQLVSWITAWSRQYPAAGSSVAPIPGTPTVAPGAGSATVADWLGVPASTPFDAALFNRLLDKIGQEWGQRARLYLWPRYQVYVGKATAGEIPFVTQADGSPEPGVEFDLLGGLAGNIGSAVGSAVTNAVVLIAIVAVIVIAIYAIVRS